MPYHCPLCHSIRTRPVSLWPHLEEIGYAHTWWVTPGVHDYVFWNASLPASLGWLSGEQETAL